MDEIQVSVLCTVYNHEKYLRQCLEGFVSQKTNFAYEVVINDDASMDSSAEIIKEFVEKYPDIIVPLFQRKNLYKQGKKLVRRFFCRRQEADILLIAKVTIIGVMI